MSVTPLLDSYLFSWQRSCIFWLTPWHQFRPIHDRYLLHFVYFQRMGLFITQHMQRCTLSIVAFVPGTTACYKIMVGKITAPTGFKGILHNKEWYEYLHHWYLQSKIDPKYILWCMFYISISILWSSSSHLPRFLNSHKMWYNWTFISQSYIIATIWHAKKWWIIWNVCP